MGEAASFIDASTLRRVQFQISDAKRKRDSAQPQERIRPISKLH